MQYKHQKGIKHQNVQKVMESLLYINYIVKMMIDIIASISKTPFI